MPTERPSPARLSRLRLAALSLVVGAAVLLAPAAALAGYDSEYWRAYGREFKTRPISTTLMAPLMLITLPFWFIEGSLSSISEIGEEDE